MKSYINAIGTANPAHRIEQSKIADFMANSLAFDEQQAKDLQVLYRATGIQTRYSVLSDFANEIGGFSFFPNNTGLEPFPTVKDRMLLFQKEALPLALEAIRPLQDSFQTDEITHLITVSCTGMYAPGLDLELVESLGLPTHIHRTAINYMGCYAAFNALKLADQFCKNNGDAKVLVVCLELCSLHFQKNQDPDTLLSNALFGDGAAAVLVTPQRTKSCLSLEGFFCDIVSTGKREMAWSISDFGFEMKLSSYVPDIIKEGVKDLTHKLLDQVETAERSVDYYAIHPGGKRILEVIEEELQLDKSVNQSAYEVLREYGNMSSPTVLFVIAKLWSGLSNQDKNKNILSFAFGPGLTLESMILKYHA